ncbi:Na+/H+ antiporter NhaC family protein [Desulfotruncus alcoholivorax]|uniref:Na+/H+ antiporter NhaC family protein n=1 Tax=Desulfotruncus alcoholivorax TaxID=265477 RepID=UPI00040890ED|nr:Na+/H+ antiporter NhaC family protein [Desulfotruncus alcoholivorax]
MDSGWLSIIPFLMVIPVAIWTKQIIPGLTLGLITGAYLVDPSPLGGLQKMLFYIIQGLTHKNNLKIIIFLYLFSGLVEIIKIAGGIKGFAEMVSTRIKTKTGALVLTWFSTLGTFSTPTFRIVTITPILRSLLDRLKMPARELAYMIEVTSAPVIVMVPVATAFVGYMTSIIHLSLKNQGIASDAYALYIKSIPFNFFSISILLLGLYLSFFHHDEGNKVSATESKDTNKEDWHDCHPVVAKDLPSKPLNLLVPLLLLLGLTFFVTWLDGYKKGRTIFQAFLNADVLEAMVIAALVTFFITVIFFTVQKIALTKIISHFIIGGNELMTVILLLAIVWGLTGVTDDLGFSKFVTQNTGWIPQLFVPPVLFLLGSFISYFIGSAWGTWGILMPLGISLGHVAHTSLPLVIGAVFASGTFGSFASPLSGDTVTITKIMDLPVLEYAKYKLKSALIAAGIASVLYFIAAVF